MAYWQFQFSLVPSSGIEKVHGPHVLRLAEYESRDSEKEVKDIESFNNYWEGIERPQSVIHELTQLLPACRSWDSSASMFADVDGNSIEIWPDDINCALSLSNPRFDLVNQIVSIAARMKCVIVLKESGRIVNSDLAVIADEIANSSAKDLLENPSKLIRSHGL
jgi:hypothetical protein